METQPHCLLRIYTDEAALLGDRRVFELLLDRAREARMLGATIHRAQTGFGHSAHVHRRGFLDHNYPVIVEIVDVEDRIRAFWAEIATTSGIGLVTLERVETLRGGRVDPAPGDAAQP
ncbi:DUF190 domain-containing protein [Sphingomonas sp. MA1305]|jgi:PII-like signaling protein|uniref:DUF190 domain-containing protein n=1 Tax=Sphingomonas sp. MA1305 TaxID=2479204 RepID=UPI0018DFD379|nr:DUF190 domain-containing protein [Sphingomonas sp. MA1305]MBI0477101.1 DUF190 domain-containing protein [Sphingomonas sp. MA1305]